MLPLKKKKKHPGEHVDIHLKETVEKHLQLPNSEVWYFILKIQTNVLSFFLEQKQLLTHQHWSSHVLCTCAFWAHLKNWILNLPWCFSDEFSPSWSCRLVTESLWTQSNRRAEHVVSDHSLPVACAAPERIKELQNPFPPKPDKIVY